MHAKTNNLPTSVSVRQKLVLNFCCCLCACLLAVDQGLLDAASANRTGSTANSPFGYDPVFGTYSSLWNIQLVGQEGSFYNLTAVRELSVLPSGNLHAQLPCVVMLHLPLLQGSREADVSGNPFGFMVEKMPGAIIKFPALFTTEMSADRSTDVLQYLLVSIQVALHRE